MSVDSKLEKSYLGDGVYISFDGYHVILSTSDGEQETNAICLDPYVLTGFLAWIKKNQPSTLEKS